MDTPNTPDTYAIRKLADFIETVPRHQFNFAHWVTGFKCWLKIGAPVGCGTTGCGLGWATVLPQFKKKGLEWKGDMPSIDGESGMGYIGKKLFGIEQDWTERLFVPGEYLSRYCTPKQWADNARAVADELDQIHKPSKETTEIFAKAWASAQTSGATKKPMEALT